MAFSQRQVKIIITLVIALAVFGVILWLGFRPPQAGKTILTFWSVYEKPEAFGGLIARFEQETGIKIELIVKNPTTYEQELVDALASGRGPDILAINNAWLLKHGTKLYPAPSSVITNRDLQDFYPEVVVRDFTSEGYVYGIPLSVDTPVLFYNQAMLDQAGIVFPPKTWEELTVQVPKLAKVDKNGIIERAAVSLGTANNIRHASDLVALLMMQLGSPMVDAARVRAVFDETIQGKSTGAEALQFFTRFAESRDRLYTWNRDLSNSFDMFARGDLAMTFGYARDIPLIREKAAYLDFRVAEMPQPAEAKDRLNYANYWAYGVTRTSRHPRESWEFVGWLTNLEQARVYMRRANKPPARRELIGEVKDERILGVFASQALSAQSWYQPDATAIERIFTEMIGDVNLNRRTPQEAVKKAADQINLLFR